jgi:hypothetical protein
MNLDEAIAALLAEMSGAYRGNTATPGHLNYEAAVGFTFQRCNCSYADREYGWHEYIAVGTEGRQVVALNLHRGKYFRRVTVGTNGFHRWPNRPPACH